ncbi:MAG: YqiJ family protein [Anaerolineae bacterium]|nr:YqiJ family protein [Anaerolineae bacterium]
MFALCVVMGVAQLIGLGGDVETEADVDADADADLDGDVDVDGDADADANVEPSGALAWLAFLGVGKAPVAVVLLLLFGAIAILGWVFNSAVQSLFGDYPSIAFVPVVLLALMGAALITSRVSRFIGRALPPISTTAMRAEALVGKRGTVISPFVDAKYGQVRVRDQGGTLITVFAVAHSTPIPRSSEVALVSYDMAQKRFTVEKLEP